MSTQDTTTELRRRPARRFTDETKQAFRTTEFWTFVVLSLLILIAGNSIEGDGGNDYFGADKVWLYVTILAGAYFISRGLAKSGSYAEDRVDRDLGRDEHGSPLTERVKTAAAVLKDGEDAVRTGPGATRDHVQPTAPERRY